LRKLQKLLSIAVAAFLMATAPAHAVIIDNGTVTTDTGTGLDWLDLTASTGFSFAGASAEFGVGGAFEGYRHATESELDTFLTNAGFGSYHQDDHTAPFLTLINLLGITGTAVGEILAQGHFDNGGLPGTVGRGQLGRLTEADGASFDEDYIFVDLNIFADTSSANVGNFLVQDTPAGPVPEPGALAIFAIGFAGVVLSRRRRLI
jgi:hypothetical protein